MKGLNKILITIVVLCCFIFWTASAQYNVFDNSDCWIFGPQYYKHSWSPNSFEIVDQVRETKGNPLTDFLTPEQQKAIITKNDLNTALLNLKKYCCENELWWLKQSFATCMEDNTLFNDNTPDNPYLFNHLFDVIMRRLKWLSGENLIYTKTNMTLDDKWAARRQWITEHAISSEWSVPQTIIDEYKKFRAASSPDLWYNIAKEIYNVFSLKYWDDNANDFLNYVNWNKENESKSIANALQNYSNWTLYDRYINACALSEYFYGLLERWKSSDRKKISNTSCDEIIKKQIHSEMKYTSWVVKDTSNRFLNNYIKWYKDYLTDRQLNLQSLRTSSVDKRLDVIRAVPCLQPKCVK